MSNLGNVINHYNELIPIMEDRIRYVDKYVIYVNEKGTSTTSYGRSEGTKPHAHIDTVSKNSESGPFTCIRLDECSYSLHDAYTKTFNEQHEGKLRKDIDKFLRKPFTGKDRDVQGMDLTNWEYLVFKWNRSYPKYKIPDWVSQPDYSNLPNTDDYHG